MSTEHKIIRQMLSWMLYGGACSDCETFREAPSCIDFIHEYDCGVLELCNRALAMLGRTPEYGHAHADPEAVMRRLAQERAHHCNVGSALVKMGEAIQSRSGGARST